MSQPSLFTRRNAIQNALFSSLIPALVSSKALGNSQRQAVSNRVSIALIGAGGMGNAHLDKLLGRRDVDVLAVCDVYEPYRNKTKKRIGEQCAAYNDYRYILDRKDIDAVLIATPRSLARTHHEKCGRGRKRHLLREALYPFDWRG